MSNQDTEMQRDLYVKSSQPDLNPWLTFWTDESVGSRLWRSSSHVVAEPYLVPSEYVTTRSEGASVYSELMSSIFLGIARRSTVIDADDIDAPEGTWFSVKCQIVGSIGYESIEFSEDDF
jgi:hypothetical protein